MKIINLLYTVFISGILIFSPSFSLSQARFTVVPVGGATTLPDGFCCSDGQVISSSQAQCKKRGQYYQTRAEAFRHCRPNKIFCCINGKVSEISPEQCKRSRGISYSTVVEAKKNCKSKAVYCCLKGKIVQVSPEDCKKKRGRIYKTTAEAKRKCKSETVFCCLKGSVKKTSSTECKTKKGAPYRTEREARKNCGWCCVESKVLPITPDVCKSRRGNYFTSKVQADQQCKEQLQCCVEGKLVTYSQLECKRNKGKYYRSRLEAKRRCRVVVGNLRPEVPRTGKHLKAMVLRPNIPGKSAPPRPNPDPPPPPRPDTFLLHPIEAVSIPSPAISITSPAQGDFMAEGGQFVLQWSATGNIPEKCVNIHLFKGALHEMTITHNVCINGYSWQLPQGLSGTGYTIRIRTVDNAYSDTSDPFSILSAQPDLRISNFHIQPAPPNTLDDITVRGTIQNAGHGTSASTNAVIRLQTTYSSSNYSGERTVTIPSLVFGPNAHVNFSETFVQPFDNEGAISSGWTYMQPAQAFELLATVEVDSQNLVTEADEGNNSAEITFTPTSLPNLRAQPVKDDIYAAALFPVSIVFTVRNYSSVPVGPTVCRTWIEDRGHENHNVPALDPGKDYIFARRETFALAGWRNVSFTVDHGNMVAEFSEDDNSVTGRFHVNTTRPFGL